MIDGKTVQQIRIEDKIVYTSGPIIRLTADKSFILAPETVTISLSCEELPYTEIQLYCVINMTKTLLDTLETDENGQATYTYEGEGAGTIGFVAEYDGSSSNTVTVDDYTPAVTDIALIADTYSFNYGGSVTLTATVKDQHNQAMSGQTVTFKNGSTTLGTGTTNSSGVATLTKSDLNAGTYNITAEISTVSSTAITVNVNKLNTSLTLDTPVLVYSDAFSVTGVLEDSNGNGIVGATVKLEWNDGTAHTDTATTTTGGAVTFARTAPTAITQYSFKLVYEYTTNYNATESSQVNVTVLKETSVLNVTSPTTGASITGSTFSVAGTLKDNDNTAMASKNVLVKKGTTTLATLTTDSNGAFSGNVSSSGLSDGSNTLDFVFVADTYYTGATQQVTVSKTSFDSISLTSDKSILSKADNESATLSAQLTLNDSPVAISGQSVTFEVRKSSDDSLVETLSGSTNSSGIASVSYLGKGTNLLNIKAISGMYSDEIQIQDYYGYKSTGSVTHSTGSSPSWNTIWDISNIGDFELTCEISATTNKGFGIGIKETDDATDDGFLRIQVDGGGMTGIYHKNDGTTTFAPNYQSYTANTWRTVKITYINGVLKATDNYNTNWTPSNPITPSYVEVTSWNSNKTVNYRNLIVKKL